MQCLQQYSDNGGSVDCWLNDEVTDMVLIILCTFKSPYFTAKNNRMARHIHV